MGASEFISSPNSGNALNEVQYWYMDANDNTPFDLISADKLLRCHSHRFPWPEVEIYTERVRIVAIYWPYPVKYFFVSGWYFIDGSVIYEIDSVFILKSNVINHLQPQQHQPSARRYGGCWRRKEVIFRKWQNIPSIDGRWIDRCSFFFISSWIRSIPAWGFVVAGATKPTVANSVHCPPRRVTARNGMTQPTTERRMLLNNICIHLFDHSMRAS